MNILLIEDDLDDVELLQHALSSRNIPFSMETIGDGSSAVAHIKTSGRYPDIIVLDFNLPKVHGRDIITEIKSAEGFKAIPLLILTTSSAREDMDYAYRNGADKYLIKPTDMEQIEEIARTIVSLAGVKK